MKAKFYLIELLRTKEQCIDALKCGNETLLLINDCMKLQRMLTGTEDTDLYRKYKIEEQHVLQKKRILFKNIGRIDKTLQQFNN